MAGITKARYEEIAATAAQIVTEAGGLAVDSLPQAERPPLLRELAAQLVEQEQVDYRTARSHIARAFRRLRYEVVQSGWGGKRPGAGAPEGNQNARKDDNKR